MTLTIYTRVRLNSSIPLFVVMVSEELDKNSYPINQYPSSTDQLSLVLKRTDMYRIRHL